MQKKINRKHSRRSGVVNSILKYTLGVSQAPFFFLLLLVGADYLVVWLRPLTHNYEYPLIALCELTPFYDATCRKLSAKVSEGKAGCTEFPILWMGYDALADPSNENCLHQPGAIK